MIDAENSLDQEPARAMPLITGVHGFILGSEDVTDFVPMDQDKATFSEALKEFEQLTLIGSEVLRERCQVISARLSVAGCQQLWR